MIFTKREASLICRGKQTMLLAPVKRDPVTGRHHPARRYRPGTDIAVQPAAGSAEMCRIQIIGRDLRALADLDFTTARCLGFKTRADFAADWLDRHDPDWPVLEEALCARCDGHAQVEDGSVCPDCEIGVVQEPKKLTDDQVLDLFRQRAGDRLVWLVSFTVPDETPRMLAAHSERGYTTRRFDALPGEPEAVDEVTQARLTRQAHERSAETAKERQRREQEGLAIRVDQICAEVGIPETDGATRARVRDALERGIRRKQGKAA